MQGVPGAQDVGMDTGERGREALGVEGRGTVKGNGNDVEQL